MTTQIENPVLRNAPRQKRAGRTVATIEAAVRDILADPEWGRDRLTTGQVAKLAGVSIGTIYRYFPDRLALLDHVWPDRGSTFLAADPVE
ncbi:TetR/AcrR family transcriptional regulator [Marisediminicola senii]|uniref:TetR/AcrR family transcriptional regulator n=1 Tax=Marisediminicola senii TaxID=2711233 RepID=UPI0013EDF1B3|nr:TetR/AcrR family transcriptional regulator [Marisediminicola senii]